MTRSVKVISELFTIKSTIKSEGYYSQNERVFLSPFNKTYPIWLSEELLSTVCPTLNPALSSQLDYIKEFLINPVGFTCFLFSNPFSSLNCSGDFLEGGGVKETLITHDYCLKYMFKVLEYQYSIKKNYCMFLRQVIFI